MILYTKSGANSTGTRPLNQSNQSNLQCPTRRDVFYPQPVSPCEAQPIAPSLRALLVLFLQFFDFLEMFSRCLNNFYMGQTSLPLSKRCFKPWSFFRNPHCKDFWNFWCKCRCHPTTMATCRMPLVRTTKKSASVASYNCFTRLTQIFPASVSQISSPETSVETSVKTDS